MKRSTYFAGAAFAVLVATLAGAGFAQTPEPQEAAPTELAAAPNETVAPTAPFSPAPTPAVAEESVASDEEAAFLAKAKAFYDSLDRKTGRLNIVSGKVTLNIPASHYFVGAADARRILVDVWGNPPDSAQGVEGMIFERDSNPVTSGWGAVVEYRDDGHVDDDDAATIDYAKLLSDMQREARDSYEARKSAGYGGVDIVGWAEQPHYDSATHKLYWAKAIQFEGVPSQTLNYDIRALGRTGVLVISFIAEMKDLPSIRAAAPAVLEMPQFTNGSRYEDYKEGVDKKAAYGIAGLIAGGAVVAIAKKAGVIGLILAFGKKFIGLLAVGAFALFGAIGRMFSGTKRGSE